MLDMVEESVKDWEDPEERTGGVRKATQADFDAF